LGYGWGMSTEGPTLLLRLKVLLRDVHPAVWRRVRGRFGKRVYAEIGINTFGLTRCAGVA
jgi:hypothetical protein